MANQRTFYACQAVAVAPLTPDNDGAYNGENADYTFLHGVQSVGLNSTFDFENIFELGQLEIYDSVLNVPEIEITIEKVLDGYKTCWGLISEAAASDELTDTSKQRANVQFALYKDTENAGESTALHYVECTGMYINSVSYTFPVDGNLTESVTLVGNHKQWSPNASPDFTVPNNISDGNPATVDEPPGGRIKRRQDVIYTGPASDKAQNVTLTLNLAREDIFEFGERQPYAKIATYPIEATAEVESLLVEDTVDDANFDADTDEIPVKDQTISVSDGTITITISQCFLTSISQSGGDASGGNATISRSFTGYNNFTVTDNGT